MDDRDRERCARRCGGRRRVRRAGRDQPPPRHTSSRSRPSAKSSTTRSSSFSGPRRGRNRVTERGGEVVKQSASPEPRKRLMTAATMIPIAVVLLLVGAIVVGPATNAAADSSAVATFADITPDNEGPLLTDESGIGLPLCLEPCASQHNGGRVNGLDVVPGIPFLIPDTYFAASEVGGLFKSRDGAHWTLFDPTPTDGAPPDSVWDVVALADGHSYACGDDGLLISPSGAPYTWSQIDKPLSSTYGELGGYCSLAVSPEDPTVVFVVFGNAFHADIGGAGNPEFFEGHVNDAQPWTELPYPDDHAGTLDRKTRIPFVVTNDRSDGFDVWVADGSLWRIPCHSGQMPNCETDKEKWSGSFTDHLGSSQMAHGDSGDLIFRHTLSPDACPALYSSDGGVYANDRVWDVEPVDDPPCQTPDFRGANWGLHAFDLHGMAGSHVGNEALEDLYMATQDNGLFYTANAGDAPNAVSWDHRVPGDVLGVVADSTKVVAESFSGAGGIQAGDPGFVNMKQKIPAYNDDAKYGFFPQPFWDSQLIAEPGPGRYLVAVVVPFQATAGGAPIPAGVRDVKNLDGAPLGEALGEWTSSLGPCHIQAAMGPTDPVPYVLAGSCWHGTFGSLDELWTYTNGAWVQRFAPKRTSDSKPGFSLVAVDPKNPLHIYASVVGDGAPRMVWSIDGGRGWLDDLALSSLMNDGFRSNVPDAGDGIFVMPQPNLIA